MRNTTKLRFFLLLAGFIHNHLFSPFFIFCSYFLFYYFHTRSTTETMSTWDLTHFECNQLTSLSSITLSILCEIFFKRKKKYFFKLKKKSFDFDGEFHSQKKIFHQMNSLSMFEISDLIVTACTVVTYTNKRLHNPYPVRFVRVAFGSLLR